MCHFNDKRHKAIRLLSKRNVTLPIINNAGDLKTIKELNQNFNLTNIS